jgi:hypothetical protein
MRRSTPSPPKLRPRAARPHSSSPWRLARCGPDGIRREADDGYADLQGKDGLQLGSPTGFRALPAPLLAGDPTVRAAPDLDGDGVGDLAVMSPDNRTISVVRGGPQGLTLGASTSLDVPKNAGVHFEIADVDGDGLSDLVVLLSETLAGPPSSIRTTLIVRLSTPGADISRAVERCVTWSTPAEAGMGLSAELFVADVDGLDDIHVFFGGPHVGRARVVRGAKGALRVEPGTVGFQPTDDISGVAFFSTGDVNGDQRDDVLFVGVPSVGFTQAFDLFAGGKSGLEGRPFAQYTIGANNRVPRRH